MVVFSYPRYLFDVWLPVRDLHRPLYLAFFLSWVFWRGCVKMMCLHTKCLLPFSFHMQIIGGTAIREWICNNKDSNVVTGAKMLRARLLPQSLTIFKLFLPPPPKPWRCNSSEIILFLFEFLNYYFFNVFILFSYIR